MCFANYSDDAGKWLAIVAMIAGAVVLWNKMTRAAGNALKDGDTRKRIAGSAFDFLRWWLK